jgi:hypothetical protein
LDQLEGGIFWFTFWGSSYYLFVNLVNILAAFSQRSTDPPNSKVMATDSTIMLPHGRSPNSNIAVVEYIENDEDEDFNINHISDDEFEDEATANHGKLHVGTAGMTSSVANLSNTILGELVKELCGGWREGVEE